MNRFAMDGRVAVVTGGASGLGLAMAEAFAEAGAAVALLDIDGPGARRCAERLGGEAIEVDAGDRDALRSAIADVAARHGRLDVAVANAGISAGPGYGTERGRLSAVEDSKWDEVVAVNLTGVFATIQAAAAPMREQRSGAIIVNSSIAGLTSEALVGYAYAATKAGAVNLVRQAAMELAPHGVRVNGIAPGPFRTNIGGGRINEPEVEAAFCAMVPMGRIAEPEEMKGLALLLASDAGSYITGVTVPIDGGATAK